MEFLAGVILGAVVTFYDEAITAWLKAKMKAGWAKVKSKLPL